MSKYVDASLFVEMQLYDDEYEEWEVWNGTIEDLLNQWTEQGCPPAIEVSEDCISRQQAIEEIALHDCTNGEVPYFTGKGVQEILNTLPPVTPTERTGWIPVSERLPENNGRYLVSYEGIIGMRTNILHYGVPSPLHTRGAEKCFYDTDREYGDVPYEDVIAWQPLPEPYKGGDTE